MCHVPYTPSTACRETETAMRDLAAAFRYRQAALARPINGKPCLLPFHRMFRLATDPLGYLYTCP